MKTDDDVKKYDPKKSSLNKSNPLPNYLRDAEIPAAEMSEKNRELRGRQEDYLFRGYGNMLDTSEMIDFSEGADSD